MTRRLDHSNLPKQYPVQTWWLQLAGVTKFTGGYLPDDPAQLSFYMGYVDGENERVNADMEKQQALMKQQLQQRRRGRYYR